MASQVQHGTDLRRASKLCGHRIPPIGNGSEEQMWDFEKREM